MCYHIIRWHDSVSANVAIKRCYRTREHANTDRRKGLIGDRTTFHLDPHNRDQGIIYSVVKCPVGDACGCAKWNTGHNRATIPAKELRLMIVCGRCYKPRRNAVEVYDPETEEREMMCQRCYERYAAGVLFKATRSDRYVLPKVSHVHAEDPDLAPVAVLA